MGNEKRFKMNKTYLDKGIFYIENFISKKELNLIKSHYESDSGWIKNGVFYEKHKELLDPETLRVISDINMRVSDLINNDEEIANSFYVLQKFLPNDQEWAIYPHSDRFDYRDTGSGESRSQYCTKGFILYYNDNYEGGEVYYLDKEIAIKPKPGMLLVHSGSKEYIHGVKAVKSGERWMSTGFVYEKEYLEKNMKDNNPAIQEDKAKGEKK